MKWGAKMNNVERFDELYNINTMTTQKGSFFRLQKILFEDKELKELSLGAKVLYAFMCDRIGLSVKNGWTDERGCIFIIYPVAEVCEKLGCKKDKARKILSELENFGRTGLIRRKKQGLGRPDKIFVVEIKEEVRKELGLVVNKHKEFAESMRNIMRNDEKNRKENNQRRDDNLDEDSRSLQEILEQKFDELFGPIDDEEE